jgi:hypothetical protein
LIASQIHLQRVRLQQARVRKRAGVDGIKTEVAR